MPHNSMSGTAGAPPIRSIRILPPMVIARFGSSPSPMDNYNINLPIGADGKPGTGFRKITPAPTLIIDDGDGSIRNVEIPTEVRFRDEAGRIRPIAPFLEVWVEFEEAEALVPLTLGHLTQRGLGAGDLKWRARAGNFKVYRRTDDPRDRVTADTQTFSDHGRHELIGHSANFKPGKCIPFGHMQYIKPTSANPEIRARFTPGAGRVFGPRAGDPHVNDDVYFGATSGESAYAGLPRGRWDRYYIGNPGARSVTAPGDIFQGIDIGSAPGGSTKLSSGYLDDTCDGIIEASITVGGKRHEAYARFAAAVPDFAPDSLPVRSIADDMEQIVLGPSVSAPAGPEEAAQIKTDVEDILRRGLETVRLTNTMVHNGNQPAADVLRFSNNTPGQQTTYGRAFEPIFEPASLVEYFHAMEAHLRRLGDAIQAASLSEAFAGGMRRMRLPEEAGDLRKAKRGQMPAMMRGSDGLELVLTRRQLAKLKFADPSAGPAPPGALAAESVAGIGARPDARQIRRPLRSRPSEQG
jgi:hypothetical protein